MCMHFKGMHNSVYCLCMYVREREGMLVCPLNKSNYLS